MFYFPHAHSFSNSHSRFVKLRACAPNPTQGLFSLVARFEAPTVLQVQIFDAAGKIVLQRQTTAPAGEWSESFDLSAFPNGLFFVRVAQEDRVWMGKVIKN